MRGRDGSFTELQSCCQESLRDGGRGYRGVVCVDGCESRSRKRGGMWIRKKKKERQEAGWL